MNTIRSIQEYGQSIWLDLLSRKLMDSGELKELIEEEGLRGLTSNPAIFEKAIRNSNDYDADIERLAGKGMDNQEIFFELALADIRRAADLFGPVHERTGGRDGFVSLEVSPHLARDTKGTIAQAMDLWKRADRKNVMIKIPGTAEGLPAIRKCVSEGLNINITLLFGLDRYRAVVDAYLGGLEDRLASGKPIDQVHSVASFFLSRIDVMADPLLVEKGAKDLKGRVAIASAKKAYEIYGDLFSGDRFRKLASEGARTQRLLWASTSTKDPTFRDVKYVEALIGRDTVNTVPMETLEALLDHALVSGSLTEGLDEATQVLERLAGEGIDLDRITADLVEEGIDKFNKPFDDLLQSIADQKEAMA